jgi:hypothetical protein
MDSNNGKRMLTTEDSFPSQLATTAGQSRIFFRASLCVAQVVSFGSHRGSSSQTGSWGGNTGAGISQRTSCRAGEEHSDAKLRGTPPLALVESCSSRVKTSSERERESLSTVHLVKALVLFWCYHLGLQLPSQKSAETGAASCKKVRSLINIFIVFRIYLK